MARATHLTERRALLRAAGALGALQATGCTVLDRLVASNGSSDNDEPPVNIIEDLAHRTFRYFWETTSAKNGLAPDRWPSPSVCSIAAVGFALTAYCIGVERNYVSREEARERTLLTLRFLRDLPQGPRAKGVSGYRGFFYHFVAMDTGLRDGDCELSTVDTALLLCGALHAQAFFDGEHADEVRIRRLVDELATRVDWRWAQTRPPTISLGWKPESGFLPYDWRGYNEAAVVYLLALGHPTRAVDPTAWTAWTKDFRANWSTFHGQQGLSFPPLFGHQYSNVWVDFRDLRDAFSRRHNIDYAENSRRAAHAQRAYAMLNPKGWRGYDADTWGFTACDGPADMIAPYRGQPRRFYSYHARGAGGGRVASVDDGTIAPTAAASSIGFAPDIAIPAIHSMVRRYGAHIYGKYGFVDSFNPSFTFEKAKLTFGKVVPGVGWVATDYLGIDQGPILAMIANFTNGSVWQTMTKCVQLRRGLQRAGFTGGWLEDD
ncbi:MAG TPA: glucoamylase family protein [Burkholderiaceae bacterium]|jgi:hypothetical protein|nr:glucoamylase family protein [Burkholderiaceae bacterium]